MKRINTPILKIIEIPLFTRKLDLDLDKIIINDTNLLIKIDYPFEEAFIYKFYSKTGSFSKKDILNNILTAFYRRYNRENIHSILKIKDLILEEIFYKKNKISISVFDDLPDDLYENLHK